jgi:hypothetical protein
MIPEGQGCRGLRWQAIWRLDAKRTFVKWAERKLRGSSGPPQAKTYGHAQDMSLTPLLVSLISTMNFVCCLRPIILNVPTVGVQLSEHRVCTIC